jgi:putative ABC transport system permease protein
MTLAGLAVRNVLRNTFRAVLTVLGVAVATVAFIFLRTLLSSWTEAADFAVKDRLVTRHKITFVMTLPHRYIEDVRNTPHIKVATFANWFGAKDPKHDREFFANIAVDTDTFFKVYDDMTVPPDQMTAWLHDPQGAIVGDVLAQKMGWKVGDKVSLESGIYPVRPEWDFKIDGIYSVTGRAVDRSSFYFHWKYLNDSQPAARRDQIGWIASRVDNPSQTANIGVAVDKVFDEKDTQTLSQDERAFTASFLAGLSAVLTAVNVISVVILVIMMLVLGNTIAMGVRERTNEYGVLKALGFSGGQIAIFVFGEAVTIALTGGVVGVIVAYPFVEIGIGRWLEENMGTFFPYFRIPPAVTVTALALTVALGAAAAAIPALTASRLRVVDALRRDA